MRDAFSRDLEKLREAASRAEERLRATEKRALMEIDRERSATAKTQKELADAAKRAEKREAEHRRTVEALQAQQGDARHQNGVLQGKLTALEAAHQSVQEQLKSLRIATPLSTRGSASDARSGRGGRKPVLAKTARTKARP